MMPPTATDSIVGSGTFVWRLRPCSLQIDHPIVVGVLNVTPDSFSDGGAFLDPSAAEERAHEMFEDGADLIDIGGESTRPGAPPVSSKEEWSRIGPVLARLGGSAAGPISVDTTKARVAALALEAGASAINDVSGLRAEPEIASVAARTGAGLVLMHMRGDPRTMQANVDYEDLVGDVRDSLADSMAVATDAGCRLDQLVVDPGIGFGKSPQGSLQLLNHLESLADLGRPIMVGPSRKSFIGSVLNLPVDDRVDATIAACVVAFERGASIFRVHDVREVRRALDLADSIRRSDRLDGASGLTAATG